MSVEHQISDSRSGKENNLNGFNYSSAVDDSSYHFNMNNSTKPTLNILMNQLDAPSRSRSPSPTRPLLNTSAPLAKIETDEELDTREVVNRPYPGVDDGFFSNGENGGPNVNSKPKDEVDGDPDVEFLPRPTEADDMEPRVPSITPRVAPDGGSTKPNEVDISKRPLPHYPEFPQSPGFRPWGWDVEVGGTLPSGETIPDLNVYQQKKTLAQGMMDLALFSANANQLRYVLETFKSHPYYYPSTVLISLSLILQVAVGVGLIWNATYNVKDQQSLCIANRVNNFTTICVFFVTIINVFISAFGVAPAPS